MNVAQLFFENAREHREKTAFSIFQGEQRRDVPYAEVVASVKRLAKYLSERLDKGERVAICFENRIEWCIAYLAIVTVGGIAVPIDAELGEEEIRNILLAAQVRLVFCSDKTAGKIQVMGFLDVNVVNFDKQMEEAYQSDEIDLEQTLSHVTPEDLASIIYTSGTTGVPKGVMLTHRNFSADMAEVVTTGILAKNDNVLAVLPLHHTYAFMCTFLIPLVLGGTITYPASLKGPDLAQAVKESGVTILIGVPQLLDLFYSAIRRNIESMSFLKRAVAGVLVSISRAVRGTFGINAGKILFGSVHRRFGRQLRIMASGGASLSVETMRGLETFGFTVLEGYGLTETSPVVAFNPLKKRKPGSVGKPLPNVEIKIHREDKDDKSGEGEIVIKGEMVMKGYYHMPEETEKVLKDGWFYSGDLGYMDKDGYLFITGRKKEVIVLSSGKNIYPEEIEQEYLKLPLVREMCVVDKKEGDAVTLHGLVVPDFDYARTEKIANLYEALKWDIHGVSLKLPQYMRLKGFTLDPEPLPRTRLGKLKRFMVKDILSGKESEKEVPEAIHVEEMDSVSRKVVECVGRFVPKGVTAKLSDNLELDLGIDSLKRIEIAVELEKTFSISIPDTFLVDVQTVAEMSEKIKGLGQQDMQERRDEGKTLKDILLKKPDESLIKSVGLVQGKLVSVFVGLILKAVKMFFRVYFRSGVEGLQHIPESPFILVANHASYLDSFFIASHIPRRIFRTLFFQGAQKYFDSKVMQCFARAAHVIPIDPDAYLTSALSLSAYVLEEKKSLCIFPEGGRSFDGNIMPFRKGVAILSYECTVPLVPARIRGTYESMPRGAIFPKRTKTSLVIGPPITLEEIKKVKDEGGDYYQAIADLAWERVKKL